MPPQTLSSRCPRCGYIRYDLSHMDKGCGGLILCTDTSVVCKLCGDDMRYMTVTCANCGHVRKLELVDSSWEVKRVRLELYETVVILSAISKKR